MLKIGHRGAAGHAVENTAQSLQKALDLKVDMIELDVHLCASGELVVFHDRKVSRVTDSKGAIKRKTLAEIKKLHTSDNQEILTLVEALQIINGRCGINIELKHRGTAASLAEVIKQMTKTKEWSLDKFIISSFHHRELRRLKDLHPEIRIGLLYYRNFRSVVKKAKKMSAFSVHFNKRFMKKKLVESLQAQDIKFFVWTANTLGDINRAKELGVDGIITDFPELV